MNVDDAIRLRRSARRYTDRPVPDGVIDECLRLALLAPTGGMAQAWSFIVVRDPDVRTQLAELVIDGGAEYFATVRPPAEGATAREHARWAAYYAEQTLGTYLKVPVWIIATRVPRNMFPADHAALERDADLISVAFAMENLFVAARARGIGTVATVFHQFRDAEFRSLLGIPDDIDVPVITPFGYPEEFPTGLPPALKALRRPWHSLVFDDRWEEPHVRAGSEPADAGRPDPGPDDGGADADATTSASADETIDETSAAEDAPEVSDDAGDHEGTEPQDDRAGSDGDSDSSDGDDSDADDDSDTDDEDPDDEPDRDGEADPDDDSDGSDNDDREDEPDPDDGDETTEDEDDEPDAPRDEDDDEPDDEPDAPQDEDENGKPDDVATPGTDVAPADATDDTEETSDHVVSDGASSIDGEAAASDGDPSADDAVAEDTTASAENAESADDEDAASPDDAPTDEQPVDAASEATEESDAPPETGRGRDTHIADRPAVDPSDWTRPRATPPTRPASWGRAPQRWEPRTPPTPADTAGTSVAVTRPPAPAASDVSPATPAAHAPATASAPAPATAAPSSPEAAPPTAAPARVAQPQKPSAKTETAAAPRTATPADTAPVDEDGASPPSPTAAPEATPATGAAEPPDAPAPHTTTAPPPSPAPVGESEAPPAAPTAIETTAPATPQETSAEGTAPTDDARVEDDPAPATPATAEAAPAQSEEPAPSRPRATSAAAVPSDVIATATDDTTGVPDEAGTGPDFEAGDEPPARTTTSPGLRASRTLSASEVIAAARTELGLSRIEIAEIIGATPRLVDEWITGTSEPGRHLTDQIEALRGVVTAIHEAMSTRAARVWLSIPSAELDYYTPLDVLRRGELYLLERTLRDRPRDIMLGMALRPDNDEPAGDRGTA